MLSDLSDDDSDASHDTEADLEAAARRDLRAEVEVAARVAEGWTNEVKTQELFRILGTTETSHATAAADAAATTTAAASSRPPMHLSRRSRASKSGSGRVVITLRTFLIFIRPFLSNVLTLADAYTIFVNLATMLAHQARHALQERRRRYGGSSYGDSGADAVARSAGHGPPVIVSAEAFRVLLTRLAQRKFPRTADTLGRFLGEIFSGGVSVLREPDAGDVLQHILAGPTLGVLMGLEPRMQEVSTGLLQTSHSQHSAQHPLTASARLRQTQMFVQDTECGSWGQCVASSAVVHWSTVRMRLRAQRIVNDDMPESSIEAISYPHCSCTVFVVLVLLLLEAQPTAPAPLLHTPVLPLLDSSSLPRTASEM